MVSGPDVVNDFEAWATVSSRLIGKGPDAQKSLLAELGVGEVWRNANLAWARAIASDMLEMRLDRAQQYAEICARVLDREAELALATSISDDLGLQTTHRMKAHPPGPVDVDEETNRADGFRSALATDRSVELPKRNQAKTETALNELLTVERHEEDEGEAPVEAALEDSSDTVLFVDPSAPVADSEPKDWTVDRYARYIATHDAGQETEQAIDERFGVDDPVGLRSAWSARFDADETLKTRFDDLLRKHIDDLSTIRR